MPRVDWTIEVLGGAPAETIVPGISGVGASALRVSDGFWRSRRNLISALNIGIKGFLRNSTGPSHHSSFFIARFVNPSNYYVVNFFIGGSSSISRVKGGIATAIVGTSAIDFPAGITHTPRFMVHGTNPATVQLDKGAGTPVILRGIDPGPITSPGSAGFGIHTSPGGIFTFFDDLTIFEVLA